MTEIKYKDTVISLEAGQTVTLNTADKKLTGDIEVTAPKDVGGGDTRDVRTLCIANGCGGEISFRYEGGDGRTIIGNGFNIYTNIPKDSKIRIEIEELYGSFERVYCEQLGGEIATTIYDGRRVTEWFTITDNIFDFRLEYEFQSGDSN